MITLEQRLQLQVIASQFENFECVECAQAMQTYLRREEIEGKRIILYTGSSEGFDSCIYDDSIPGSAISENGRHEGIAIMIGEEEVVFDNHHPQGILRDEWMANLQFHSKVLFGQAFQVTEDDF